MDKTYWLPRIVKFMYICPQEELHMVKAIMWFGRPMISKDTTLFNLPNFLKSLGLIRDSGPKEGIMVH